VLLTLKGHAVGADDRNARAVPEGNRAVVIDEDGVENCADDAGVSARNDADAGSETHVNGELRGVFASDKQAALLDEFLEMLEAVIAQTGRMSAVESMRPRLGVRSEFCQGHGVVPHWNSVDDVLR